MLNRHELPPLLTQEAVQTSAQMTIIEPDVPGIVSLRDRIKKPQNAIIFHTTGGHPEWLNKADNRRFWPIDANGKRLGEVLDTTDPLPLTDFGAIKGVLIGIPLGGLCLLLAWGIAKGIIGLISWIMIGIKMLPSVAA